MFSPLLSLPTLLLTLSTSLPAVVKASNLLPRQGGWAIQNWANDFADVDFRNLAGGAFNVSWDNSFAGNFVVGKGYRPGRDM